MPVLKDLISDFMSVPGHVAERDSASEFVGAALRTAKMTGHIARANILRDVSNVLACDPSELDFLFSIEDIGKPARGYEMLVPDYQTQLMASGE